MKSITSLSTQQIAKLIIALAMLVLAYKPFLWLLNTWQDVSYDSTGVWAFGATLILLIWSVSSPLISLRPARTKLAIALLISTALLRLLGQVLAINTLGALALVVDVYAIALLLRIKQRECALSAGWLAILFAFSLPIERIIQRVIGYDLQELSSSVSCNILTLSMDNVSCSGTRIAVAGKQFLIDLPCAGTNSLVVLAVTMTLGMVLARPGYRQSALAMLIVLISAFASNILRILLLVFASTSEQLANWNIDVMAQPWHDMVGFIALAPFLYLILRFCLRIYHKPIRPHAFIDKIRWTVPDGIKQDGWWLENRKQYTDYLPILWAIFFLLAALTTVNLQRHAIDSKPSSAIMELPTFLGNQYAQAIALLPKEKAYFTQFGGDARKAIYGKRQLLITKTSSPLRHLHAPDECLRGLGFAVSYLGSIDQPINSAIYKAISPDGSVWKVAVSFFSSDGKIATNVSEAVWQWLQNPQQTWYSMQRISPWQYFTYQEDQQWDQNILNALEPVLEKRK
jgi:exosortase/archaeosortase family protein